MALVGFGGGQVYDFSPTGNYKVCDNGVGFKFDSETGYYTCGDRKFDCVNVRNTKGGKPNYFCDEAVRVEVKETTQIVETSCPQATCPKVKVVKYDYDGSKWLCNENEQKCIKFSELIDHNFK